MTAVFRTDEGRVVAFEQAGDLGGSPVIYLHGAPNSRFDRWPEESILASMGVRLVTFDRPGYGLSDPQPGRTVLDTATDIAALADHLRLERFALSGMSAGGPFVLGAARVLGERVTRAAVSCGLGPLDRPGVFTDMTATNVEHFTLARNDPIGLERALGRAVVPPALPDSEIAALRSIDGLAAMLLRGYQEATLQGWRGLVDDYVAIATSWRFALDEITVPLAIWHGSDDRNVPVHHAEFVASQIRSADLHICPGEGHVSMFRHQERILEDLVRN